MKHITELKDAKFGLLGFGNVGRQLIQQNLDRQHPFNFYWLADSRQLVSKVNHGPFRAAEIQAVLKAKQEYPEEFREKCRNEIQECEVREFENPSDEAELIGELASEPKENWVIIDATASQAEGGRIIARNALGCASYCTANKNPWVSFETCAELHREAEQMQTLLGLNCIAGVWVDQMEILPILMRRLRRGRLEISKRDNSSLNIFFEKVGRGIRADRAVAEIASSGHLEPGSGDLSTEVRDQIVKAKIVLNICALLRGIEPSFVREPTKSSGDNHGPLSMTPSDIANWHLSGRKRGNYPALITRIRIEAGAANISCSVDFDELSPKDPLAKDLGAKNAISIQASEDAQFDWPLNSSSKKKMFVHSGYGGGSKTATKLLSEAERVIALFNSCSSANFSPLPVLWALENNEPDAKRLEKELAGGL